MGGIPSKPGDPSRPLEVIGAGFSRTGTMSMQLALEELLRGPVSKIVPSVLHSLNPADLHDSSAWRNAHPVPRRL
jgi:hypothetical protein